MREEQAVTPSGAHPGDNTIGTLAHLLRGLAVGAAVSEQVPARSFATLSAEAPIRQASYERFVT